MSDGDALLDAIRADPGDDLVRLAYADWLDDQGEADRAEFIRLQIARETDDAFHGFLCLPERPCKNCRRERALRDKIYEIGAFATFRRGFVERVVCTLAAWQQHGPALVRAHPVTRVELTDARPNAVDGESGRHFWQSKQLEGIFAALPCEDSSPGLRPHWKRYPSRDLAYAALIAWAKLPPEQRAG